MQKLRHVRHQLIHIQALHLETGQEPVDVLIQYLDDVAVDNLFVNFDPANMILYGTGEPLPALEQLGSRVRSVHCKDATWSDRPGETWGREMPLGEGDVDFTAFLKTLQKIGYDGPLTIEREIPQEPERQKAEIGRIDILATREGEILAAVTGQILRTGIFQDKAFTETIPYRLRLKVLRNPNMTTNGRFPTAVADFKYETIH